jgi:hypothetical protein
MWVRAFTTVVAFLMVCASVARSTSAPGKTGITGVIMVTPVRPGPARKGSESPNAAPLPNAKFTVTGEGGSATTFVTNTMGHFEVSLKQGHYVVVLAENRFPKPCGPFEVDVEAGKMTNVDWRCDSGMR